MFCEEHILCVESKIECNVNFQIFFIVSHSFGYGLMDATAMVRLARKWKTVPAQHICNVTAQVFDKYVGKYSFQNKLFNV